MNNLAKEINILLLNNPTIKEYLELKNKIDNDKEIQKMIDSLNVLRKEVCNKKIENEEYYLLLNKYKSNEMIKRFECLKKEIQEYFVEISDILSLN